MKTIRTVAIILLVCAMVFSVVAAPLQAAAAPAGKTTTPGVEAAKAISLITGVAISPLLGVGAVGAWEYYSTPAEKRGRLPWYAQPAFWIPALLLVAMVGAKDIFGTGLPVVLKKPFDVAETIEDKISALVVAGAFVPLIARVFPQVAEGASLLDPALGFAAIDGWSLFSFLAVPVAIAVFFVVWLASHAINILVLISPFSTVDAALKLSRLALLSFLTVVSFLSPYAGALVALLIIAVCYFLAGWAFRLMTFGNVYAWDFLTLRHRRFAPDSNANWMFTAEKLNEAPIRTYGKLTRSDDGRMTFEYRPWLVLPKQNMTLPSGNYAVGKGLLYSEVLRETETLFILPPRFRSHEERVAQIYQFDEVRDVGLLKGFKAIWLWSRNLIGFATKPVRRILPASAG